MRVRPWIPAVFVFIAALWIARPATAQVIDFRDVEPPEGQDEVLPTPTEIIDRHIEATGGRLAYARIVSRKLIGTFRQNNQPGERRLVIHEGEPNNRHVVLGSGAGAMRFVTNADESWTYDNDLVVASTGEQRMQEIRRAAFHMLLDWNRHYILSKTLGIEDVGGRPAYVVQLTSDDCHRSVLYFDRESGLHVRTVGDTLYAGTTIQTDATYSDYQEFDGVRLPTRSRRILNYQGTRFVQDYVFTSIEHNVELPNDLFATPFELLDDDAAGE